LAGIDRCLDSRRRIDAIAVEISVCVHGNIANMNTDSQIMRATGPGGLFGILLAQHGCGAHSHFCAWKFGENRITQEFNDSAFVALDGTARKRLQDFDQLQRPTFILHDTCAVAGDISKPECSEMMRKRVFSHRRQAQIKYASRKYQSNRPDCIIR
jgi:hypothetical protein